MRKSTPRRPILLSGALACGVTATVAFGAGAPSPDRAVRLTPAANRAPLQTVGGTIEDMPPRDGTRLIRPKDAAPNDRPRQRRAAGPLHRLTVSVLDRAGRPPEDADTTGFAVYDLATGQPVRGTFTGGTGQVEVPAGTYRVGAWIRTPEPGRPEARALMIEPSVPVTGATGLTLDARATKKVEVSLDTPGPELFLGDVMVPMTTQGERHGYGLPLEDGLSITPAAGVSLHVFTTWTRGGAGRSPYRYVVLNTSKGRIPGDPTFRVRTAGLATVRTTYPAQGRTSCVGIHAGPDLPDMSAHISHGVLAGTAPGTHTVHATPGILWPTDHTVGGADCTLEEGEMTVGADRLPGPGHYTRRWHTAPLTPGLADWSRRDLVPAVVRRQDQLEVAMSLFCDGAPGHVGPQDVPWADGHITGRTTLTQDGRQLGSTPDAGYGTFTLPGEPGRYRLETTAERNAPWSPLATRTEAAWTFTSARTDTAAAPPLMTVRYDAGLDDHSRARAGAAHRIGVTFQAPPGAEAPDVRRLSVQVSYDDGKTWQETTVRDGDDGWTVSLRHPADAEYVSLRASAADAAGNTVEQTTIRAYALRM